MLKGPTCEFITVPPVRVVEYFDERVCLSVNRHISGIMCPLCTNFLLVLPVAALARSSFGSIAIHYVLAVLWMTVIFAHMEAH